jgi:hypothetical protein
MASRPDPIQHQRNRAELRRELEAQPELRLAAMPLGPQDLALLGKATGYGVNAIKALVRIHAEGGMKAASEAAILEASRIFGTGMRSLGPRAIKQRVAEAMREFSQGVERLKSGKPLFAPSGSEATIEAALSIGGRAPALSPRQEARQTMQIKSWAQEEIEKLRAENPIPQQSRRATNQALRDKANPPSKDALGKRQQRADAKLPADVQQRLEALRTLMQSEYKGGRTTSSARADIRSSQPVLMCFSARRD